MDTNKYCAYNQTRGCFLSGELTLVDAGLEPLRVLKILIEGLSPNAKTGLWLTHFRNVPVARTLSPFDLIYLDSEHRVVHGVELSIDGEFTPFKGQPASALVLPSQSISSSKTRTGDQLNIQATEERAQPVSISEAAPVSKERTSPVRVEASSEISNVPVQQPADDRLGSPLEQFLAKQSSMAVAHARVQQNSKSLLELSPSARTTAPKIPMPGTQTSLPAADGPSNNWPSSRETTPASSRIPASPSRAKIEQFPSKVTARPPSEFVEQSTDLDAGYQPDAQERASLLMRILSLRFLSRDHASRRSDEVDKLRSKTETVPSSILRAVRWLYPEFEISTEPRVAPKQIYTSKTKFQREVKPTLDMQFLRWMYPTLRFRRPLPEIPSDRRLANRLPKPGLVAYYFTGGPPRAHNIGNISVTGFYMYTEERWMPGTIIRMTLQLVDSTGENPTDTITVHSRVVRWGNDGEGFEFVLAGFLDEPMPVSFRRSERPRHRSS